MDVVNGTIIVAQRNLYSELQVKYAEPEKFIFIDGQWYPLCHVKRQPAIPFERLKLVDPKDIRDDIATELSYTLNILPDGHPWREDDMSYEKIEHEKKEYEKIEIVALSFSDRDILVNHFVDNEGWGLWINAKNKPIAVLYRKKKAFQ